MPGVLYSFPGSIWAAPPRLVLAEKHITDVTIKTVDISNAENYSPEFLEINPKAHIPVIETDDARVNGSTEVCEYIDSTWEGSRLLPSDKATAAEVRAFITRIHEPNKDPNLLFFAPADEAETKGFKKDIVVPWMKARLANLPKFKARAPQHAMFYGEKMEEARQSIESYEHPERASHVFEVVNASWAASYEFLDAVESQLEASGGPLLFGTEYTLADAHFTAWLARLIDVRKEAVYEGRSRVAEYWAHVQQRESFQIVWPKAE